MTWTGKPEWVARVLGLPMALTVGCRAETSGTVETFCIPTALEGDPTPTPYTRRSDNRDGLDTAPQDEVHGPPHGRASAVACARCGHMRVAARGPRSAPNQALVAV
jgi:hypothetical protein